MPTLPMRGSGLGACPPSLFVHMLVYIPSTHAAAITLLPQHASAHTNHASAHTLHASAHTYHATAHTLHATAHTLHACPQAAAHSVAVAHAYTSPPHITYARPQEAGPSIAHIYTPPASRHPCCSKRTPPTDDKQPISESAV